MSHALKLTHGKSASCETVGDCGYRHMVSAFSDGKTLSPGRGPAERWRSYAGLPVTGRTICAMPGAVSWRVPVVWGAAVHDCAVSYTGATHVVQGPLGGGFMAPRH